MMNNNELLGQFFIEFIKLVVSGILGGAVVSFFNHRLLRSQKKLEAKYELQRKKLDALRSIDSRLHWLHRDIHYNWEKSTNKGQDSSEYLMELIDNLHYWETLFLNDEKIMAVLKKLSSLVGASKEEFYGKDALRPNLGKIIDEIKTAIRNGISEIQKDL